MSGTRYTLLTGEFYIRYPDLPRNGPEPDGDTISFLPDSDGVVQKLPRFSGIAPDRRHLDTYSVRFESIDALETHFENQHQNLEFAQAARDRMLQLMGFGEVQFWPDRPNKIKSAQHHPIPGYLLANGIESNGRVLSLVFPGQPDLGARDGDSVFVDGAILEASLNAALVREGLAYGELYATMPLDLISRIRQLVKAARQNGSGFWPKEDVTVDARVPLQGLPDLTELIMFPKLYRRLVTYFKDGYVGLASFDAWIRADPVHRDDQALLPTGELGNLHDLYDVDPDGITLRYLPEDLTFQPDPTVR
ncbi:MAG TPA: thermonuclease family protein [Pseudonocardiaceae bacterium]